MQRCLSPTHEQSDLAPAEGAEWFRAPFDATTVGMVEVSPDSRILRANEAFCRMTGYAPVELGELTVSDLLFPEDRDRVLAQYRELASGHGRPYEADRRYRRKDGSTLWARVSVAARGDTEPVRVCALVVDLSERKQMEEQIWHSQRVETAGLLAICIAHDLNNLLTVIRGTASLLEVVSPADLPDAVVREMSAASERATGLTSQLLAFGRKAPPELRAINLNDVVAAAARLLPYLLGKNIALVTELADDLGAVVADPTQMEQVILNLAANARDAMPRGGRLVIETRTLGPREQDQDAFPDLPPGRYAILTVSDTGTGMTDEVKARAFEPFFTTKEPGKGTGLGLVAVSRVAKRFGGRVNVVSEVGSGTKIHILLPVVTLSS